MKIEVSKDRECISSNSMFYRQDERFVFSDARMEMSMRYQCNRYNNIDDIMK